MTPAAPTAPDIASVLASLPPGQAATLAAVARSLHATRAGPPAKVTAVYAIAVAIDDLLHAQDVAVRAGSGSSRRGTRSALIRAAASIVEAASIDGAG